MTKSFLKTLTLGLTFGVSLTAAGLAVACLGLWLIGLVAGGDATTAGARPVTNATSAMR